ncbi:hypothetical protein SCMU_12460 [Sinomonas cyclohexanicum]|uniref:Uncharacterized protein n=1 Tax=Sinomonas cyclohexanicum TaxID=322009 RepID=A0ABM7PT36_SINCY|nr:hypothetical protein SCMU_12460 [Corynebacterium cyclohexanicum]
MRLVGGVALLLVAGYLVVLGFALLGGGPNAAAPFLPPAAAPAQAPSTPTDSPSETLPAAGSGTPLPAATENPITVARYLTPAQGLGAQPAAAPGALAPAPTAAAAAPAPAPTAALPAPTATVAPGQGQSNPTAPGQLRRPTTQPTHP